MSGAVGSETATRPIDHALAVTRHAGFGGDADVAARLVGSQAFILDRVYAFDGFRQISTIGLGVGFAGAAPVCSGDSLRRATVCGLGFRSIDNAMLNHNGRIIVVTNNTGS